MTVKSGLPRAACCLSSLGSSTSQMDRDRRVSTRATSRKRLSSEVQPAAPRFLNSHPPSFLSATTQACFHFHHDYPFIFIFCLLFCLYLCIRARAYLMENINLSFRSGIISQSNLNQSCNAHRWNAHTRCYPRGPEMHTRTHVYIWARKSLNQYVW